MRTLRLTLTLLAALSVVPLAQAPPPEPTTTPALFSPVLPALPAAAGGPCTIYCNNTSNLSCSSETGDCAIVPGDARDFLVCDGKATPCPPYVFP